MSIKYNNIKGIRFSLASFIQQYSSKLFIESLLPLLIFFPFLILSFLHTLKIIFSLNLFNTNNFILLKNDINEIYLNIYKFFILKNPTFIIGANSAFSNFNNPPNYGSDVVFEMHGFFPFILQNIFKSFL